MEQNFVAIDLANGSSWVVYQRWKECDGKVYMQESRDLVHWSEWEETLYRRIPFLKMPPLQKFPWETAE
jgi:hypothetical protein